MKTFLKKIEKPLIHEAFYLYAKEEDYQEYEAIDKEAMHTIIQKRFIDDCDLLLELKALPILIHYAKEIENKGAFTLNTIEYASYIEDALFLVDSYSNKSGIHTFSMPPKIVQHLLKLAIDAQFKEKQLFYQVVIGMLEVYGVLTHAEIGAMYQTIRPSSYKALKIPTVNDYSFLKDELLLKGYRIYEDGITHPLIDILNLDIDVYLPKKIYKLDDYLSFSQKAYVDHIYAYYGDAKYKLHMIKKMQHNLNLKVQSTLIKDLKKDTDPLVLAWPLWSLGGILIENMTNQSENLKN